MSTTKKPQPESEDKMSGDERGRFRQLELENDKLGIENANLRARNEALEKINAKWQARYDNVADNSARFLKLKAFFEKQG